MKKKIIIKIEPPKTKANGAKALFKKKRGAHHNREYDAEKGKVRKGKYKKDEDFS